MSRARTFSKMINKANYRTHRGHSAISEIEVATETTTSDTASVLGSTAVPALVGMIAPFSMETTTEWRSTNRWIICDGSPVSRTAYNHLFDVIGTIWGVGDGSSTFNLPDLRGEFLRGFDNGHGNDGTSGRTFGSSQAAAIKSHPVHIFSDAHTGSGKVAGDTNNEYNQGGGNVRLQIADDGYPTNYGGNKSSNYFKPAINYTSVGIGYGSLWANLGNPYGHYYFNPDDPTNSYETALNQIGNGEETRPRNITVQYCIKY